MICPVIITRGKFNMLSGKPVIPGKKLLIITN